MDALKTVFDAPDAAIPWDALTARPWWSAMVDCPQDPIWHGEGDVATHTRLVVEALRADSEWRSLPTPTARAVLLLTALLHDCGKPTTTETNPADGRITSNGHARVGSILARRLLWEAQIPFAAREAIVALIRWHMRPSFLVESDDAERKAITIAQTARCDQLALFARADARGRIAPEIESALLRVDLFREFCAELGCAAGPFPFASDHSRFVYFRTPGRDPRYHAHDDTRGELLLLSGLPGAGKDTWVRANAGDRPVVSLDAIRKEMGVAPTDPQEGVVLAAIHRTRDLLRAGASPIWNATNLKWELRARPIQLAAEYRARVRIVYVEAGPDRLFRQNRQRDAALPAAAMERMLRRWEIPTAVEAHSVEYHAALP